MMDKTLLQKKQQIIEFNNRCREGLAVEAENRRILERNKNARKFSLSECIDDFKKSKNLEEPVAPEITLSTGEDSSTVTIGKYPLEVSFSVGKDFTVGIYGRVDASVPVESFPLLAERLSLASELSEYIASSRSKQVGFQPVIDNIFFSSNKGIDPFKLRDQVHAETARRLLVGNVIRNSFEASSFRYENCKPVLSNDWSVRENFIVCTDTSPRSLTTVSYDPETGKFGKPVRLNNTFYFERLPNVGDRYEMGSKEFAVRNHFLENIEPPEPVKNLYPKFEKPVLTAGAFEAEFAYQVSLLFSSHESVLGSSSASAIYLYKNAGKAALACFADNGSNFEKVLKDSCGITDEAGFIEYLTQLAEKTSHIGIEHTAEELIRMNHDSFFPSSSQDVKKSSPEAFSLNLIQEEVRNCLTSGRLPEELSFNNELSFVQDVLRGLSEKGTFEFRPLYSKLDRDSYDSVLKFLENRGLKVITLKVRDGVENLTVYTPESYPDGLNRKERIERFFNPKNKDLEIGR